MFVARRRVKAGDEAIVVVVDERAAVVATFAVVDAPFHYVFAGSLLSSNDG